MFRPCAVLQLHNKLGLDAFLVKTKDIIVTDALKHAWKNNKTVSRRSGMKTLSLYFCGKFLLMYVVRQTHCWWNAIQFNFLTAHKARIQERKRKEKGEKASIETIMIIMLVFHVIKINFVNKESHMTCNYHRFLGEWRQEMKRKEF